MLTIHNQLPLWIIVITWMRNFTVYISTSEFSESLREMGTCLLERTGSSAYGESGKKYSFDCPKVFNLIL